ncbi:MAG: hypothetical protein ACRDK4_05035 [Solirubrobacteraceae bacterium]
MSVLLLGSASTTYPTAEKTKEGRIEAAKFTALKSGVIEEILFRTNGEASTATALMLGVYADSAGSPGAVLGEGTHVGKPGANEWVAVTGLSIVVTAGTVYWLAWLPTGGETHYNLAKEGGARDESSAVGHAKLESTTWSAFTDGPVGIQALGAETKAVPPAGAGMISATVRLQALSGTWETCGADRAISVDPESLTLTANPWGSDKASFDLHRAPDATWPDIGAFTPVEVEIGGVVVWKGRVNDTPLKLGAERVVNVQCEGWQYHLDDDTYQANYVHSKLTDWKDIRSNLEAVLTNWPAAPQVQSGKGSIVLSLPNESAIGINQGFGVILDLGEAAAKTIVVQFGTISVTPAIFLLWCRGSDEPEPHGAGETGFFIRPEEHSEGTVSITFTTPRRYVSFYMYREVGAFTAASDQTVKITGISIFGSSSYEAANASILKASAVIPDALSKATMLLSSDHSQIQSTSFNIPDLDISKQTTPREAINAVNAYHNWITKLDMLERLVFAPRPTDPLLEIGAWSGADIEDASANSGAEIYSRAIAEATGADGSPVVVERTAAQQPGALPVAISSPAAVNPSFATNTEGWTASSGILTRDTTKFNSAPASGKLVVSSSSAWLLANISGTFKAGTTYAITFMRLCEPPINLEVVLIVPGWGPALASATEYVPAGGAWKPTTITWTPATDTTGVELAIFANFYPSGAGTLRVDDVTITSLQRTIPERRGFRRTKVIQVNSAITAAEGNQLCNIFLQGHMTTPFKGGAKVAPGGVRTVLGGQQVHPSRLLTHSQELIRLSHLIDPDTGGVGRDGMIANVTYTHKDQGAQVDLDENRTNFDALLARLAVVQGVGS